MKLLKDKAEYREVAFLDTQTGKVFIVRSTAKTDQTLDFEGRTYPLIKLETSSDSHPAYTGHETRPVITSSRIQAFRSRYARKDPL